MTPEAQNIAIAGACPELFEIHQTWSEGRLRSFLTRKGEGVAGAEINLTSDLNAMREAEFALTPDQRRAYTQQVMADICAEGEWTSDEDWALLTTAADQRAKAFLKTIRKWAE